MTAIPLSYIARNLLARKLTTVLTAGGMALVVYVFATVLMLAAGLEQTLVATGPARQRDRDPPRRRRPRCRAASTALPRRSSRRCRTSPPARTARKLLSKEPVVLISLPKRETGKPSNVVIRGVTAHGLDAASAGEDRRGPHVPAGHVGDHRRPRDRARAFAARAWARRCASRSATGPWSACSTRGAPGFNSEIWGDAEQLLQAFRRLGFSALIFRLADAGSLRRR